MAKYLILIYEDEAADLDEAIAGASHATVEIEGASTMSTGVVDVRALLADDPTFDEDDEPLASQHHRNVIDSLYYLLRDRLAGPAFTAAAELRVYPTIADIALRHYREPDLLVALDRPDKERLIYLLSEEGKAPDFVFEVLSDSTKNRDALQKRRWYQRIGVREYVVADPEGRYVGEQRLRYWRLRGLDGQELDGPPIIGREGEVVATATVPYGLMALHGWVRLVDPMSGELLPLLDDQLAQGRAEATLRRAAQAQARDELERRLAAEAQAHDELNRRLAAEAQARDELKRRMAAEAQAHDEQEARRALEQEIARLRRTLQYPPELDAEDRR